jgi:hypothetical protein
VIIWLNGPFGVGKTAVMRELLAAWPQLLPFDPELVGGLCRAMVPERVRDWQDLPLWRELSVAAADGLLRGYGRPLVTPMTLLNEAYATQIFTALDNLSWPVFHVVLDAPEDEVRQRIAGSAEGGPDPAGIAEVRRWRLEHLASYRDALAGWLAGSGTVLGTGGRTPVEVAQQVLALVRD